MSRVSRLRTTVARLQGCFSRNPNLRRHSLATMASVQRSSETCGEWIESSVLSIGAAGLLLSGIGLASRCEELPVFASSSDSMGSVPGEDPFDYFYVFQKSNSRTASDLEDTSSSINKGIRAFETFVGTNGKDGGNEPAVQPTTLLSTSKHQPESEAANERLENMPTNLEGSETVTTRKMYFYRAPEMQSRMAKKFLLFSTPNTSELAGDTAHLLGVNLSEVHVGKFADGETRIEVKNSVRGKYCYIMCSTAGDDAVMELVLLVSTLRRAGAKQITAVIPYYGYSLQDRKVKRESIAAADIALLLEEMGVDRVLCMDLHNDSLRGFFSSRVPVEVRLNDIDEEIENVYSHFVSPPIISISCQCRWQPPIFMKSCT